MTLAPLLNATVAIQIHVVAVATAIALTPVQLLLQRGSATHKLVGRIWMVAMVVTAFSSFFISTIRSIGPFSPLHLLSIVALVSIATAYFSVRRGDRLTHAITLICVVIFALIGAGIFTLLPGRIMHAVIFGTKGL